MAPALLGSGENLFADIDLVNLGYKRTEHVTTPDATYLVFKL
jgi:hypothetical protein